MSIKNKPVVAAVPNFNMGESLRTLLPVLLEQSYDAVFVLDDASTDDSREVATSFGEEVYFVSGEQNVGAGANRNRILGVLTGSAIIHFIDADMHLESKDNPEAIRDMTSRNASYAFIGGLILDQSGLQYPFNYGPRLKLESKLSARTHYRISQLALTDAEAARALRAKHEKRVEAWPNIQDKNPAACEVFYAAEGNLIVDADAFRYLGGFDPSFRHHEIQDYAIRARKQGLKGYFDPSVATRHLGIDVRGKRRRLDAQLSLLMLAKKHGVLPMLFGNRE